MSLREKDFRTDHLDAEQKRIADTLLALLEPDETCGGCRAFYTPAEWTTRKEEYGTDGVLIICHDGGALSRFCAYDHEDYNAVEKCRVALEAIGYWIEQCTGWYSAIYKLKARAHFSFRVELDDARSQEAGRKVYRWQANGGEYAGFSNHPANAAGEAANLLNVSHDPRREVMDRAAQYRFVISVNGRKPQGDSQGGAFSDWYENDVLAVMGATDEMQAQGYVVTAVEINFPLSTVWCRTPGMGQKGGREL